jgi:hypothetical protein
MDDDCDQHDDDRIRTLPLRGELELPAELDRQSERHVLLDDAIRLDVGHAARPEPVANASHELLRAPTRRK